MFLFKDKDCLAAKALRPKVALSFKGKVAEEEKKKRIKFCRQVGKGFHILHFAVSPLSLFRSRKLGQAVRNFN